MFYSKILKNNDIQHCFFSRKNGVSKGIYKSLNCGIGSKDDNSNVEKNLDIVSQKFQINKNNLILMRQTHSNIVKIVESTKNTKKFDCDSLLTHDKSFALCVLTADCAPILIYESKKEIVGCIHAGWRGAFNGIIENTLDKIKEMGASLENILACVGPCIAQNNYEVKEDFYLKFLKISKNNESFFLKNYKKTYNFDLRGFVNKKLKNCGVSHIENITVDTFAQKNEYFSHRRAKKLGENDYGRCISVIKKTDTQN